MTNPTLWNQLLVWPITNLLMVFYKLSEILHLPGPLGFAIIFLTISIRLLLYPLMNKQLQSSKQMTNLKPHLDALSEKHKNDKQALQQAQLALYKEHGVNPAAGCLPSLIQLPILFALYNVFFQILGAKDINAFVNEINAILYIPFLHVQSLDITFFGLNLAIKPGDWQQYGWWLLLIPLITALLQWVQTQIMLPKKKEEKSVNHEKTKEGTKKDDMADMQRQMAIITPIMFGFFALQLPIGLALYWNVFGLFGIMQQLQVNKNT